MSVKNIKAVICAGLCAACFFGNGMTAQAAASGSWELSDNGKYWMYFYTPGDPAMDEWIEYEGKEYYVDSKGRMKTGWVTNKDDGERYYMGQDGTKCFNTFASDGKYVGPDGTNLKRFDTYRKELKRELKASGKKLKEQPGFAVADFNADGYKDMAVFNRPVNPDKVIKLAVWDPEEEKFTLAAETDLENTQMSRLTCDPDSSTTWLVMESNNGWDRDFFSMEQDTNWLEHRWGFTYKTNDWGDPIGCVNGDEVSWEDWEQTLAEANAQAGTVIQLQILPLDEVHIAQAADIAPSEEELLLWEE